MPAFATHYIFFDELKDELIKKADFEFDIKVGGIGCQGPDIFLFHRIWPMYTIYKTLNSVSGALHRCKNEKIFEAFRDCLELTENRDIARPQLSPLCLCPSGRDDRSRQHHASAHGA